MPPPPVRLNRAFDGFRAAIRKWHAHPRVLVEGDSWTKYDSVIVNPTPANLFLGTCEYFRCVSLALSSNGDTVSKMLGPTPDFSTPAPSVGTDPRGEHNLRMLAEYLRPTNGFDVLFFSGGGNDVVDNLAKMLRPFAPGITAQTALLPDHVDAQMEALRRGYLWLLAIRDRVSPHTWVVTHQYGVPNLLRMGFRRLGLNLTKTWIKPQFHQRGYLAEIDAPTPAELQLMTDIIELLMQRFGAMLQSIQGLPGIQRFYVAQTRPVLSRQHWRDEMHLTDEGFRLAAKQMHGKLRELFPAWTA